MRIRTKAALIFILVLALAGVAPVSAQGGQEEELSPCVGVNVSGTVVAVEEETGIVTVKTSAGLCTVTLDGEYDHPIVALLGSYFGDVSAESLAEALKTTQGCAVYDSGNDLWTWVSCGTAGAVGVTVIAGSEDVPCTFKATVEGDEATVAVQDATICEDLSEALQALDVNWNLDEGGTVIQPGDEIASYHEDGLGFGVLVKLYAMAAGSQEACGDSDGSCGATVEELVGLFLSGTGMGELFKDYGRPSILGVGHVRNNGRGRPAHAVRPNRARSSLLVHRFNHASPPDVGGKPENAGPKPKSNDHAGKPDDAGPKPKSKDRPGKPDHAGPKPKSKGK